MKKLLFSKLLAIFTVATLCIPADGQSLPSVTSGTLRLWLRADVGVVTNGNGSVSQWQDQSSRANHASQGDSNKQPKLIGNALSGHPIIRFDGIQDAVQGDYMQGTGDVGIGSGFTSFLVYKTVDNTPSEKVPLLIGAPLSYDSTREYYIPGSEMAFSAWGNDYSTGFQIPTNIYRIWTFRMTTNNTQLGVFDFDGTNAFSVTKNVSGLNTPAAGYFLGGLGSQTRNFNGDIAELLVFHGTLSEEDRIAIEDYLEAKFWSSLPSIVEEPLGLHVAIGDNATFSVTANGSNPLFYQWTIDNINLGAATNFSLTLSNVQPNNAGQYRVIVTNAFGAITSGVAVLTVTAPISIATQPQSRDVLTGTNVMFSVSATGDSPFYQWFHNGSNIINATNSSLVLTNVQIPDAGTYSVLVTNSISSILSSNAVLTINEPPQIDSQPHGGTVLAGETISMTVGIDGAFPQISSGALRLWLKADAGVVQSGGNVSQWIDQSSFGNSCFQSNTNKQPKLVDGALNGKPVIRFDGIQSSVTGDYLQGTDDLNTPQGFTAFLSYKKTESDFTEKVPLLVGTPGQSSSTREFYIPHNEMAFSAWANDYHTGFDIATNVHRIWTLRMNNSKTMLDFFDTDNVTNFSVSLATSGLGIPSAGYYVGGLGSQTRNFKGDIAEIMVYDAALTEGERVAVEYYLRDRYYGMSGSGLFKFQWQINGTNIMDATNATLTLTNIQPARSGNYTVTITNLAGSVTSQPAAVKALYIFPKISGQRLTNSSYTYIGSTTVSFESYFINGSIFYTLDGSTPSFNSRSYAGSFSINQTAILRAIVYSSDFSKSGFSEPVTINIIPKYSLTATTAGGGSIAINPLPGPYVSGSDVTVTTTASNGWAFIGWLGDLSGTNLTNTVTMTCNKSVQAVFGTTFNTTVAGNGSVSGLPDFPLYSYGTTIKLTAIPQSGSYFGIWGNAASGNVNPLNFVVTNANPVVSALFSTLSANQYSLTLIANGSGQISALPRANSYTSGQGVSITAMANAGQMFIGWSGDATGTQNPLGINMNQSKIITANFTRNPLMAGTISSDGFRVKLTGLTANQYSIEGSTNLINWNQVNVLTNSFGTVEFTDPFTTNWNYRFYRGVELP